jgi:hypothetical protein
LIRRSVIVFVILVLLSMVYGCITINQISPSSTVPAPTTTALPPATTPTSTPLPTSVPPLTTPPLPTDFPPLTTPPVTTLPPFTLPPAATIPPLTEDCNSFNYVNTTSQLSGEKWIVVSGGQTLLNFENNQAGAELAVNIIKFYAMTSQCFVGRPNAPMMYFLSGGNAPSGAFPGEDAFPINPANVSAKLSGGNWLVVDGAASLLNFEDNQSEANTAVAIIKKYGFTRQCFVARPHAPMMYFRK